MKKIFYACLAVLLLFCTPLHAQTDKTADVQLSPNAFASLLTCGSGEEFYTTFGHTALRLCDTAQGIDVVYNYGMFDFDEPHFYLKFALGDLNYYVDRFPFQYFVMEYAFNGRSVFEQPLQLSHAEVTRLLRLLEENLMPENRYYAYDYFADNCATRVRDIVNDALIGRALPKQAGCIATRPVRLKEEECAADGLSVRQMMQCYTTPHLLWWQLGCDLLLGARCDKALMPFDYMFLPDELRRQYDTTFTVWDKAFIDDSASRCLLDSNDALLFDTLTGQLRSHIALAGIETQLLQEELPARKNSLSPTLVFWVVCGIVLLFDLLSMVHHKRRYNKGKRIRYTYRLLWFAGPLFGLAGLLGAILLFMQFFTAHYWTDNNWNLLWCNPLYLVLFFRLRRDNRIVSAFILLCLAAAMALGCTGMLPQYYNPAILPLCVLLFYRTLYRLRKI